MTLSDQDLSDLQYAKSLLENGSLTIRIANAVGTPIDKLFGLLPQGASDLIRAATTKALETGLRFALTTLGERHHRSTEWLHKAAVTLTGAAGGAFGLAALGVELPVSTVIMLRSIADIARSEGEPIKTPTGKLACLEVFAFGGRQRGDAAAESSYFAVRAVLARTLAEAAEYITERGIAKEGAPVLLRFVSQIAARFGIPVSEKVMAQSVPVVGAAGGAVLNALFIDYFQDVARGHFIVRRLERGYGAEVVRNAYLALPLAP